MKEYKYRGYTFRVTSTIHGNTGRNLYEIDGLKYRDVRPFLTTIAECKEYIDDYGHNIPRYIKVIYCVEIHGYKKGKNRKANGEYSTIRRYARNKKTAEKIAKTSGKHYCHGQHYVNIRKLNKDEYGFVQPEWIEG